jgi:glycosyltransferase involved in cell wall biosynthesis
MGIIRLTVIIPTWNRKEQLSLLLNDLFCQKIEFQYEIIVCDSYSPDGTADFVDGLLASDSRIRIIQCKNSPAVKRNDGAMAAQGEFLLFIDDDVRVTKTNVLNELLGEIVDVGNTILSGRVRYPNSWVQRSNYYSYRNSRHVHDSCFSHTNVKPWCFVSMCSAMSKKLFFEVGGYSEDFKKYGGEDHDFEFRSRSIGVRHLFSSTLDVEHYEGFTGVENYVKKFSLSANVIPPLAKTWPQYMSRGTRSVLKAAGSVAPFYRFGMGGFFLLLRKGLIQYLDATDRRRFFYSVFLYRLLTFIALVDGIVRPRDGKGFYAE